MPSLEEYQRKRDFSKTSEPGGEVTESGQKRFCIQQHHASRMHYDLRLEHKGVLLSWAVPKGISTDPDTKRLAVQTEDHPVEYLTFEGTIPKGEYGAGKMIVWDLGTYSVKGEGDEEKLTEKQLQKGSLDFYLEGKKARGIYKLVLTDREKRQWLLFKKKDEFADSKGFSPESVLTGRLVDELEEEDNPVARVMKEGKEVSFPENFKPMLAKPSEEVFSRDGWIYEVKFDGYRCLIYKKDDKVRLLSRNGHLLNEHYPDLVEACKELEPDGVFDGEIIVADETGGGDFQQLQQYLNSGKNAPLRLVLFDLLYLEGRDLSSLPLHLRKAALEKITEPLEGQIIRYSKHIEKRGAEYFEAAKKLNLEGIIAKKRDSNYHKGKRSNYWLKFKNVKDEDLAIVGLTPSTDSKRPFGSLVLARLDADGNLRYAGKVGTGFQKQAGNLKKQLKEHQSSEAILDIDEDILFWVEPHFLAKVRYTEKTKDGKLRHPSFQTLRDDKFFQQKAEKSPDSPTEKPVIEAPKNAGLNFTNLDKIYFPKSGIAKAHVINYYDQMSEYILPYLKNRPLTLRRHPNGIKDDGFYQKDVKNEVPEFVETVEVKSRSSDKGTITYALCNNKESLLFFANWGCVELHVANSRAESIEHPDHIVFDLDPIGNTLDELKEAATVLKKMLDKWELNFGVKTSGSRGVHMYLPVEARYTHDQIRSASHVIARLWHKQLPELTSLERMPAKRQNKIYLDYLQNGRSKTMAAPYSLRVKEQAPVSMPLCWDEFMQLESLRDYRLQNLPELMSKREDAWQDLYASPTTLEELVAKIEAG